MFAKLQQFWHDHATAILGTAIAVAKAGTLGKVATSSISALVALLSALPQ